MCYPTHQNLFSQMIGSSKTDTKVVKSWELKMEMDCFFAIFAVFCHKCRIISCMMNSCRMIINVIRMNAWI